MFHILIAQTVATQLVGHGEPCKLLLWGPRPRRDQIYLDWVNDYKRLVLPDLWTEVYYDEEGTRDYDLHAIWPHGPLRSIPRSLRRMRSYERRLTGLVAPRHGKVAVYVSNITAGAIDRHLAAAARHTTGQVHYMEDGVADMLSSVLKQTIDSSYWTNTEKPFRSSMYSVGRKSVLRLARLDAAAIDLGSVDYRKSFRFDDVYQLAPMARSAVDLINGREIRIPVEALRATLDKVVNLLPVKESSEMGSALYLSRPDSEDGLLSRRAEVAGISTILRSLKAHHAGRLLLKPHPRDTISKVEDICERSGVPLVPASDRRLPAEVVAHRMAATTCYGTWTGSLVYTNLLATCRSVSVLPLLLEVMGTTAQSQKISEVYREFRSQFDNVLLWLDSDHSSW